MDELDQLAFDLHAFLFQNIFDATLLGNGLLLKQNKVFSYVDDNSTVLPIVFRPSPTNFNQPTRNFLTSIFDCQEVIDKRQDSTNTISGCLLGYLSKQLDKNLQHILEQTLYFKTNFNLNEYKLKYFYNFIKSPYFIKLENNRFLLSWKIPEAIFNDIYVDLCEIFPKGKILPYLNVYVESNLRKDSESHITIRATDEYDCTPVTITHEIHLSLLLGTLYLFSNYSEKHDFKLFSIPSSLVKNVTLKQLKGLFFRYNNQQYEYYQKLKYNSIDTLRFIFSDYKFEPIQLPVTQEVASTNLPVVAQSPNLLPAVPANPYYPHPTQVQPYPNFLPTLYGTQYFPDSYQNIPCLIVTIPPINQRSVNYDLTYKWIKDQYTKSNHKERFEKELLFLFRVEFELLKKLRDIENIHPFNLDRPLFTIFSFAPDDISKNPNQPIQLRPFDFYSYGYKDPQATLYKALTKEQQNIIKISYPFENTLNPYDEQAKRFMQMNAWGTLYLLHFLAYQQTDDVEHSWETMLAVAHEVAERFSIVSADESERHAVPIDVNDERLYNSSPLSNRGDFSQAMEITPKIAQNGFLSKEFKGENNQIFYHAIKLPELDFFIPEIFVSVSYLDFPVPMLLPPKIHHLFHEECISQHDGELCITSDLSKAAYSKDWISWWGGEKTLDKVDMTILQGKDIAYICNGFEDFELSLKVCARMKEYGAKPKIHYDKKDYHENEFFTLANQLGYENDMHGFMESQQPQKQSGTKIEIIKEYFSTRELILLLGEAKVGKTFVGLSLALSIASQMPMNDYWIPNEQFKGDIYYCFGEMDDNDIAERIYTLTEHMELCVTSHETENSAKKEYSLEKNGNKEKSLFTVDLRNLINGPFDITLPEHQQALNNILNVDANNGAFTVFDNYVSILGGSTSIGDAKFNTAFTYFMTLMDKGTCVMLAHHTNSEKEIAASKQIERKVDGVIRLTTNNIIEDEIYQYAYQLQRKPLPDILPEELRNKLYKRYCNKGLNIFVTYQYFRDKNTEDLTPLHMILDLKNKGTRWVCEEIIREEIINTITDILTRNTDNNPKGSGDYEMLKKLSPDEAKQYIYKTVLNECNGDINEAIRKPLNSIAQMYGQTDDTFAFHVGRNILGMDGRAKIKQIHDFIKDIHEKAHNQQ